MKKSYYEILGVPANASAGDIEAAYQTRRTRFQGLLDRGDQAAERYLFNLRAVYEILIHPAKRAAYDEQVASAPVMADPAVPATPTARPTNPAMMACAVCGSSISKTAPKCPHCGEVYESRGQLALDWPMGLGVVGSVVLFVGVFAPVLSVPFKSFNYVQNGTGDGVIMMVLAAVSLAFTLMRKFRRLWWTGGAALAVLLFTFVSVSVKISRMVDDMRVSLDGNPFRGLAEAAAASVQIEWGWAVLVIGAGMLLASAWVASRRV